ncbi:MAG TPA: hypothetical protein VK661_09765 [Planctomycetota bacterium]|jgi:hypothetical protein|nr:hypothetical protein [Planctomycetota bacterium]
MIAAILFLLIPPQDALQRAGGEILPVKSTVGRDRIDLRLGPALETDRCTILPSKASVDFKIAPDFACGRFDLAAGYRSLFTKSLREEMLGALIESAKAELASSAMVLACQMSPTLCDAMKHYKLVANDVLALQLNQCRAIEAASSGVTDGMRARAIKQCLAELQAKGISLDEAMRQCQLARDLRGLAGGRVEEIDLVKEVSKVLGLRAESESLLGEVAGGAKWRDEGVNGSVKVRPVAALFERVRRGFEEGWMKAIQDPSHATDATLVPPGSPPATAFEVQRVALLPPSDRRIVVASLASAFALQETARRMGEAQAALESAAAIATDPALEGRLRAEVERLDAEFRRLREEYDLSELVARARLRSEAEVRAAEAERFRRATEPWRREAANAGSARAAAPWGSGCPVERKQ